MAVKRNTSGEHLVYPDTGTPLQLVKWSERRVSITFTGSTQRVVIPSGALIVELTATESCYINFGDDTVAADSTIATDGSRLYLAGVQMVPVPLNSVGVPFTHIAAIQRTVAGILQIEEVD